MRSRKMRMNFTLKQRVVKMLRAYAKKRDETMTSIVEQALELYCSTYEH